MRPPTLYHVPADPPHIGTLRERPLHADLKDWYSRSGDQVEVPIDGFVIDLVRDDQLIEIQTRSFSSMKRKVSVLMDRGHRIRIVHPIALNRWIVKVDEDGEVVGRRLSPKHGAPSDVFTELVSFPEMMRKPGFELEIAFTEEEEVRRPDPGRSWRRKGWTVVERRLLEVKDWQRFEDVSDLIGLLPTGLPDVFTTAELAEGLGRPRRTAQQMAYCLRKMGAIKFVGKRGNAMEYRID